MKHFLLSSLLAVTLLGGCRQPAAPPSANRLHYRLTDDVTPPVTPIRDQARSGTCWAFGGVSLIESEALRTQQCTLDLSEMWIVRHAYLEKAVKYVRTRGTTDFGQGGEIQDVMELVDRYGIVPQHFYEGNSSDGHYDHTPIAQAIRSLAKRIVRRKLYENPGWQQLIETELDLRMGPRPEHVTVDGHEYTPRDYAAAIGFRRNDYVAFTSFSHHPFYSSCLLELPDNWAGHRTCNLPLDSLMQLLDRTLESGYTVAWNADVSEEGFTFGRGIALLPCGEGDSRALPIREQVVDQELRQQMFDTQQTTDDHIMHLVGTAADSLGRRYYKVKNSWGIRAGRRGFWYVSPAYVAGKTIELVIPCAALASQPPLSATEE